MKSRKVSIDKIIAVESILKQIELLQDFCFDSILIFRKNSSTKTINEVLSLFGSEDEGIISLVAPTLTIKMNLSDLLQIKQTWEGDSVYQIDIKSIEETVTVLFLMSHDTVSIDMISG